MMILHFWGNAKMNRMLYGAVTAALFVAVALLVLVEPASAGFVISNAATNNVSCTAGVCTPTAINAVLNAGDLQNLLASGDTKVATANVTHNINITAPITWSSASRLTLD